MAKISFSKGETLCLTYTAENANSPTHYITVNPLRDTYFLYEVTGGKSVKTKHKASSPTELYKYMEE